MCFYNGMNEYSGTFLQLVFPAYLIFIAIVLILRGHATNSYGFTCKIWFPLICACFPSPFTSDVFVVIKNHHLQLEVLTL